MKSKQLRSMLQLELANVAGGKVLLDENDVPYSVDENGTTTRFTIDARTIRRWRLIDAKEANDGKPLHVRKPSTMSKGRATCVN